MKLIDADMIDVAKYFNDNSPTGITMRNVVKEVIDKQPIACDLTNIKNAIIEQLEQHTHYGCVDICDACADVEQVFNDIEDGEYER